MSEKAFSDAPSWVPLAKLSLNLSPLVARVEAATGPDRELDRLLMGVGGYSFRHQHIGTTCYAGCDCGHDPLHLDWVWMDDAVGDWRTTALNGYEFTASLDATLALVERALPGWEIFLSRTASDSHWEAELSPPKCPGDELYRYVDHKGKTAALALLAALLRALQAQA